MRIVSTRPVLSGILCVVLISSAHAQTEYTWNGGDGNWSDFSKWSPDPTVHNGDPFHVRIDGGKTVNSSVRTGTTSSIAIPSIAIDSGDALTIEDGTEFLLGNLSSFPVPYVPIPSTNHGTLLVTGGDAKFRDVEFNNSGGVIDARERVEFDTVSVTGGTIQTSASGEVAVQSSGWLTDVTLDGTITVESTYLTLQGGIRNLGEVKVTDDTYYPYYAARIAILDVVTLSGGGTISLDARQFEGASIYSKLDGYAGSPVLIDRLVNVDNTLEAFGLASIGDHGLEFINEQAGTVVARAGLPNQSGILVNAAEQIVNRGLFHAETDTKFILLQDMINEGIFATDPGSEVPGNQIANTAQGTLSGTGKFGPSAYRDGHTTVLNDGRIAPGNSVGQLTFEATLQFGDSALLQIEIDATGSDRLTVFGDLLLDGDLQIDLLEGFVPSDTAVYQIVNVLDGDDPFTFTGRFAGISDGDRRFTSDGLGSFVVNYTNDGVFLRSFVASVPEPNSAVLLAMIGCAAIGSRRRR